MHINKTVAQNSVFFIYMLLYAVFLYICISAINLEI